eukprot:TRINITY_DN23756_c0_g1_i1.p1 TRINITY_DN23756_c0_g1~~TRINITY_DN23756_c0_g1_i1.p1  ORF type:complete len:356 (+),score=81.14 TRINITY_DN23756_c0_g1_i1:2-1069(+)
MALASHAFKVEHEWQKALESCSTNSDMAEAAASDARKKASEAMERVALLKQRLEAVWSPVHERNAMRLLRLCRANAGVYVKLGQHLSQLDYILPREYTRTLSAMLADAPQSSFEDVVATIQEELGAHPDVLFTEFEPKPIASASLAQVHLARDRTTGSKLAIKVQHRGLQETSRGDIDAVTLITHVAAWLFPESDFTWLADEIAPNLPRELDFEQEGRNCERCGRSFRRHGVGLLGGIPDIVVPEICWAKTSKRVLSMSFEPGAPITDLAALEEYKLSRGAVASLLSKCFCKQVYLDGFVHCDPHPANVLVRPHPSDPRRPQLVLLDHGLYKELDPEFRLRYSRLWKGMIFGEVL